MRKQTACLGAAAALLLMSGCGNASGSLLDVSGVDPDRKIVSSGRDITLAYDEENHVFSVTDARLGKEWKNEIPQPETEAEPEGEDTAGDDEDDGNFEYDFDFDLDWSSSGGPEQQLFSFTYCDAMGNVEMLESADEEVSLSAAAENGGVRIRCTAEVVGISFAVTLRTENNTLVAGIPADSVQEAGEFQLVAVKLFPFFGACAPTEDGYLFYPDGSGALCDFEPEGSAVWSSYSAEVYGSSFTSLQTYIDKVGAGEKWVMLPVFGVKTGDSAFVAHITKGQADTSLCLEPAGYLHDAYCVYPVYNYRYSGTVTAVTNEEVTLFERQRSRNDFEVYYTFLSGGDANYSGMARAYRDYLTGNGLLKKSASSPTVNLDLLMTVKKPLLLWTQTVVPTTFDQARSVLDALSAAGVSGGRLNLMGWQKGGYNVYPSHFPVSGSAGGGSALQSLARAAENSGHLVSLKDNFFEADQGVSGYNSRNDAAFNAAGELYTDREKEKHLLDYRKSYSDFVDGWIKPAGERDIRSVSLDNIGRLLYQNGAKSNALRRDEGVRVLRRMLEEGGKAFDLSVDGGNEYVLAYADFLYGIPESSSRSFVFTRDVPFFQMVVHGAIPYAPEIPGNFSDDYARTLLRWVEYGYVPYYSLAHADASVLKDCRTDGVVVSRFEDWKDRIADAARAFGGELAALSGVAMREHRAISDTLTLTVYDNGSAVLVNYGDGPAEYEGHTVPAASFTVIDTLSKPDE